MTTHETAALEFLVQTLRVIRNTTLDRSCSMTRRMELIRFHVQEGMNVYAELAGTDNRNSADSKKEGEE